ncbi:MAG TPA: hypothetical protein VJW76_09180 [Verrucomicrobiae bacterium]|nr:hypothetical protein [Verrucomicrobiae bacterium]
MKRTTILGLVILSLVAPALHRLVTGWRYNRQPVPTESKRISNTARGSKTPTAQSSPTRPTASIQTGTALDGRSETREQIGESVSDAELPALCESLARGASLAATDLREQLIRRWAQADGPAAAAWAAQLRNEPAYHEALNQVALGWAGGDLAAALNWARTLPEDDSREAVTLNLAYETARTNPAKALEVGASLESGSHRDDLFELAISQWSTRDFTAAVQWANREELDASLRQRLLAAIAVAVAGQDGAAAATLTATALPPGEEQDRVAVAIVQRWVQNEPESAASWVAQFPDGPTRETAAHNLVAFWAAHDREAAAQLVADAAGGDSTQSELNAR